MRRTGSDDSRQSCHGRTVPTPRRPVNRIPYPVPGTRNSPALLGKIEAYAKARASFSYGDIFAIVTPHRFTQTAINAANLQNEQEAYSVFALDGGDINALERAETARDRRDELYDKVRQAEEETRRSKIRRAAQEDENHFRAR